MKPRIPLPPACPLCRPYRGLWRWVPNPASTGPGDAGSLQRCSCARGQALSAGKVKRVMAGNKVARDQISTGTGGIDTGRIGNPPPVREVHDGKMLAAGDR